MDATFRTVNVYFRSDSRYNSNTFGIDPNDEISPVQQDSGVFPTSHLNYLVYNVGRTEVYAELKYGTKVMWHGTADTSTILPGEKKILVNGGKPYYVTGLRIYNNSDTRAVVHCATADDAYYLYADREPGTFDEMKNKLLRQLFVVGLKHIPYVGSGLSGLVEKFWPENQANVWEQIQDKVRALVDERILQTISGVLTGDLRYYQERLTALAEEMENGAAPENLQAHYMNIAQDLIGFEHKFRFTSDTPDYQNINQYILPHFSAFVMMKMSYYVIGIRNAEKLGLSQDNINSIKTYAGKTIQGDKGAGNYINQLYEDRVDYAYSTWYAEDLYDNIMNVRTYISTQGLEYVKLWNYMLQNPFSAETKPYNDVISYSTFYGRQTANLIYEATLPRPTQPLTPKLLQGKRTKLASLDIYIWRFNKSSPAKIGGAKLRFENNDDYVVGNETNEIQTVEFNGSVLEKLEAYGWGAVDYLVFHFSDGRIETCGTQENHDSHIVFQLGGHHIVSVFMASDNYSLGGQAANIAVSYQLNGGDLDYSL
ncbi:hypothetical protein NQ315_003056 [Exocentrus adspersus]|uniref:Uncharacterized protein n=1 Tax=Exocentrus adspersus TaxID=1586481 RepID=A0AAV8W4T0_9CUCU|nr:hypothetical protein NQ315_003056 [Exocentrus adspersus]